MVMNEMPYRHVPTPDGWEPSPRIAALVQALAVGDAPAAVVAAQIVRAEIGTPETDADARTAIEHLVRAIAENRRALLPLRAVAPELIRVVKNPWRTHGVAVDPGGMLAELSDEEARSVRVDPALKLTSATDGLLGRPQLDADGVLRFRHRRNVTATVEGSTERLVLLLQTLPAKGSVTLDDLRSARVPGDPVAFDEAITRRQAQIQSLLDAGRALVEAVERLVCALYGVPDSLTERVVESAVSRAESTGADDE